MTKRSAVTSCVLAMALSSAVAGERAVVSLKDFSNVELKTAGIVVPQTTTFRVKALGGGGDHSWGENNDDMFAYAWIINADTRSLVWKMDVDNTSSSGDDRKFDDELKMGPGSYEVYFCAATFASHGTFKHFRVNVDHRESPLFGKHEDGGGVFEWFKSWWSDDLTEDWNKRSKNWGMEMLVDDAIAFSIKAFDPPKELKNIVLKSVNLKDSELIKQGFQLSVPMTLSIYAVGEGRKDIEVVDGGWIVDTENRKRVWEMDLRNTSHAGGAGKNLEFAGSLSLDKGNYVLYYITDDSHSAADWNSSPPYDPLHWGITISVNQEGEKKNFTLFPYIEEKNVIVRLTKATDSENLRAGFGLKDDTKLRIYAFGERSNSRRLMVDYGYIMDAATRNRVWNMDVDRTHPAGGASKNRYVDEIVSLPKGNYIVGYITDDSHAYNEWNTSPPFDPDHYGITVMGAGEKFSSAMVTEYVEGRDKNIIAQISRVGDDEDLVQRFTLDRTTKMRLYAIGEGSKRQMYDYGWIENEKTGDIVWEMTYSMSQHAGGARKNKMVNMAMLLDKGDYKLRYRSDDSHSYNRWNDDPPYDQYYWGITLFKEEGTK